MAIRLRGRDRDGRAALSEFLERIQREIRERLAASRAAVREHERLEAALHALEGVASRATRPLSARGKAQSAAARASQAAAKPSGAAAGAITPGAPVTQKRRATGTDAAA